MANNTINTTSTTVNCRRLLIAIIIVGIKASPTNLSSETEVVRIIIIFTKVNVVSIATYNSINTRVTPRGPASSGVELFTSSIAVTSTVPSTANATVKRTGISSGLNGFLLFDMLLMYSHREYSTN